MVIRKHITHLSYLLVLLTQFVLAMFSTPALAQIPVGYWKFDDGFGTRAMDSSGNGHTASLLNGVAWTKGVMGDAVSANAGYLQYVSTPSINLSGTNAVTVTFWANRTYSTSGGHELMEATKNFNNSTTGFALMPDDNTCGGIQAALRGDVGYTANCYAQPSSGVWHHLALVFDKSQTGGNEVQLYLDGVLQPVVRNLYASTNTNQFGNNPLYFFARGGTTDFNSGMIDDLRLFNTALTAGQIQQIYNSGDPPGTLSASPASLSFGNVNTGDFESLTVSVNNNATGPVTVSSVSIAGSEFSLSPVTTPFTLPANGSAQLTVTFSPTVIGVATGTVTVTSNATDPTLTIPLSGTGVGTSQHSVALSWTASTSPGIAGYNAYRSNTSGGPYSKLNSSLITTTSYTDQAVQAGYTYYYVVTAVDSQGDESAYSNQAVATIPQGTLSASPASLAFGNVYLNTSLPLPFDLTNIGNSPVTVSGVSIAGAEFSLSPVNTPFTLSPRNSMQITVTFTPTVAGPASGTVAVTSDATDGILTVPLTGTGVAIIHTVALSWTASTSPGIAGYNVYRSNTSGGPYAKLNSALISSTNYTDQTVQSGYTYYYVATAVNTQGVESAYSNQASATIP